MAEKTILDVCCGSKMFWFDRDDDRVIFCDRRAERHTLNDKTAKGGQRDLVIEPNIISDFTALPFPSNYFQLVVFDPPHYKSIGNNSWLRAKYGRLEGEWRLMLRDGFSECFRVLTEGGTLIFKWASVEFPLSEVLQLTPERPLFGHNSGKHSLTHWVAFTKPNKACSRPPLAYGMQGLISLQASMFAEESPAINGGG